MTEPQVVRSWRFRVAALLLIAVSLTVPTGFWMARCASDEPKLPTASGKLPSVGGVPLFSTWPADTKPDAVIVLSGQTFGYLRPCGCSVNQKGGLERRANLIDALRTIGWPVVAVDLGDIAAPRKVHEQDVLKYRYAMLAMREMGYVATGVGEKDFDQQLWELLARYTYQVPDAPPIVLAANLVGVDAQKKITPRTELFQQGDGKRPAVEALEVATVGGVNVGFTSVVGKDMYERLAKIDPTFGFLDNAALLKQLVADLAAHPKKPTANVLLYQGIKEDAVKIAAMYPQFNVILCQSGTAESEPPQFPTLANDGKTIIVQVGHKGQNVGVVGLFKTAKGIDVKYQFVQLTEDFLTPEDKVPGHKVLALLEQYAAEVKKSNLMAQFTAKPQLHSAQIQNPGANLTYAGSESCAKCHAAESQVWNAAKHSHAMEALEKLAKRPMNRQFDGECVVCHTVGFGLQSGYTSDEKTPQLRHVGCESCHGPGSGHNANPADKALLAAMSPWKTKPDDKLPPAELLKKLGELKPGEPPPVVLTAHQLQIMTGVSQNCMSCHDQENDPKFDLNKYWPQVAHSGLKANAAKAK